MRGEDKTEQETGSGFDDIIQCKRYRKILKPSLYKKARQLFFQINNYVFTIAGSNLLANYIFRALYLVQIVVSALVPMNVTLWVYNSLPQRIVNVISFFVFLIPGSVSPSVYSIVSLVLSIFMFMFFLLYFFSVYIFSRDSKLPDMLVTYCSIFVTAILPFFALISFGIIAKSLLLFISGAIGVLSMIPCFFSLLTGILSLITYSTTAASFLSMRLTSTSIMSLKFSLMYHGFGSISFVSLILASYLPTIPSILCAVLAMIFYGANLAITFNNIIWQNKIAQNLHRSANATSLTVLLIIIIQIATKTPLSEIHIVVCCVLYSAFYIIFTKITKNKIASRMALLDQLEQADSLEEHENIKVGQMTELLFTGYFHGHPFAHSLRGFDLAEEKWPKNKNLIVLLLRSVSIYPDQSHRLKDTLLKAVSIKSGDFEIKKLISEGQSLLQQRERSLSKSLKRQLSKIKEKSDRCIGNIRHIWECIIRGSVTELEQLSSQLKKMEDDVTKDYNQLLSIFSNNPYVVRAYATFLSDVACNQIEGSHYMHMYKTLRSGARILNEKSYFFALKQFPSLPTEDLHLQLAQQKSIEEMASDPHQQEKSIQSFTIGVGEQPWQDDETENKSTGYVESLINTVRLPSLRITKIYIFIYFIIVSISVIVTFESIYFYRMKTCAQSYSLLHTISLSFIQLLDASFVAFQYGVSSNGYADTLRDKYIALFGSAEGLPEEWESDKIALRTKIAMARQLNEEIESILPTIKESGYFPKTISLMFEPTYEFCYYNAPGIESINYCTNVSSSYQQLSTFFIDVLTVVLNSDPADILNSTDFFSITHNSINTITIIRSIFKDTHGEFSAMIDRTTTITIISTIIIGIIVIASALGFFIYIIRENERERGLIYSSFKTIPKSTISTIIQKLNVFISKNIDESEENKLSIQEENALRLLSTSNTQKIVNTELIIYLIIPVIIFFIFFAVSIFLLYKVPKTLFTSIKYIPRALRNLISIPTYLENAIIFAYRYCLSKHDTYRSLYKDSPLMLSAVFKNFVELYPILIKEAWYGTEEKLDSVKVIGDLSSILSNSHCTHKDLIKGDKGLVTCGSFEIATATAFHNVVDIFQNPAPTTDELSLTTLLLYIQHSCMENTIGPAFNLATESISSMRATLTKIVIVPVSIFVIIILLAGIFALTGMDEIGKHAVWSLRLLLFCPQQVILNSKVILKILSNDFSDSDDDSLSHGTSFYETLVSHLLNGTIFLDNQLTIRSANSAVPNILGVKNEEILGKNLRDVLTPPPGKESGLHAFFTALDGAMESLRSPDIECEAEILSGKDTITVQFNLIAVSVSGEVQTHPINAEGLAMLALVMKDLTATIAARTLLKEEHEKGERLLNMILPRIIVQKLQKGESNISFSVQSASILFMDLVSFTPWCSSLPAATVMKTLNKLFALFDQNISRFSRLIKIKCIGDCYMAAGGIFDEVNQPAEHCKQAISFCLDSISALELFDIENHLSLKIRVGINCGGPIIAGVLGIDKPTFDILGPDISIAANMEHNGVPMAVHIPQHMYELVYDQPFQFKERGEMEIKGKIMRTYLVTGYT